MARFRSAIVVGASSGIGREIARQLASEGTRVAAVARRGSELDSLATEFPNLVLPYSHDVTDFSGVPQIFEDITRDLQGLDAIFYVAGVMPAVGENEFNFDKDRSIIEVNVLGAMAWLNLAAARFASVGRGSIVAVGSVAGDRGRSGQPAYSASKAALATYMESLRNRLTRKGVCVVTVKPGPVATPMTQELNIKGAMPVELAARKIISRSCSPGEHYLKLSHRGIFFMIRHVPSFLFRRLRLP